MTIHDQEKRRNRYPAQARPISRVELKLAGESCFDRAIEECVAWIVGHAGVRIPKSAFNGIPFATGPDARAPVEAQRLVYGQRDHWFFQLHDPDRDVAARRWDAGAVVRKDPDGASILISLDVLLGGGELDALKRQLQFRRTAPGLVRQLADKLTCRVGNQRVQAHPVSIGDAAEFANLKDLLFDPDRILPLIVFSESERLGTTVERKAQEYSARLVGIAECLLLSEECTWMMTEHFGKEWSVFHGAIRVYRPGMSTDDTESPYEHPIFLRNRGEQFDAYVDHMIRETTTARYELPSPRYLFDQHYRSLAVPETGDMEEYEALKGHVQVLESKISELSTDIEGFEGLLIDAGKAESKAATDVRKLSDENERLQERVAHLQGELASAEEQLRESDILSYRYLTRHEIDDANAFGEWAEAVLSPYISFSSRALDGLDAFKNVTLDDGYFPRLSQAFFAIRDVIRGLNYNALGEPYRGWQIQIAPCFANRNDIKNYSGYDVLIDGIAKKMEWHAKWGRDPDLRSSFRVYFHWDEEKRHATVGFFPRHLSNNLTRGR